MIDENEFSNILNSTNIFNAKEFTEWDWKKIDEILDIVEYRKELITELYRRRFFKKMLYIFMPSKNLFVNITWVMILIG